jgi:two-component system, chemotaxis family, CheB/CheR fusion protein
MLYNDAYIKLLGDKHVALGKSLLDVWPEARETIEPMIAKAFAGESVLIESAPFTLLRHGYPEETWFDFSFSPLSDTKGRVVGLLNTTIEMTKREKKLRESEERFRTLFENSPFGVFMTTPDGAISAANPAACEMLGKSEQEIRWLGRSGILDSEDPRLVEALEDRRRTGRIQNRELTAIRRNGERFPVEVDSVIIPTKSVWSFVILRDISERKRAEQRQREIEEKFSRVFEKAPIPTSLSRVSDGALVDVNRAWEAMFGVPRFQALGKTPAQLGISVRPEQRPRLYAELEEKGSILNLEVNWYRIKENLEPILLVNLEVMEFGGERYVFTTMQDITERKKAEEALRKSKESLLQIFSASPAFLFVIDPRTCRHVEVDDTYCDLTGFSKEEILGKTSMELGIFDSVQSKLRIQEIVNEGGKRDMELDLRRKTGEILKIFFSSSIIEQDGRQLIVSSGFDITERKRAEKELKDARDEAQRQAIEAEERGRILTAMMEHIPIGILIADAPDVTIRTISRFGREISGRLQGQIEGLPFDQHAQRLEIYRADGVTLATNDELPLTRATKKGEYIRDEIWVLGSRDGTRIPILCSAAPIRDSHGRITSGVIGCQDITDLKHAEEALRKLADELEQRVAKRTFELEQANRAKDQFLANMSHEIRTPMAGVLGMTEILLHQELPEKVQDDLEMIRSSAESVMTLINDLFDLSRISQGRLEFRPIEYDVRALVKNAIDPFEFEARSRDLDFIVSIDESVPPQILCDKDRLGQVIKNLVSNAIKFTKEGFVRVNVQAEKNDEDTLRLNFTVADSGMGIPKNKQKEVFSAFTQLDPSYSKKFAGMGLGLAISKSLVEGMGGEISVESTWRKGATFRFYVTCGIVTEEQEPTAPSITLQDLPPMTILVAEDNAVNRLFLRRALVTAGHKVEEAENGRDALKKLKDTLFDLVLMDIQMPEMDGIEATRRIRSGKHGRADIPIIALTAYAMKGDREKFLENGMDGYVTKPVDFDELARTIVEVCGLSVT